MHRTSWVHFVRSLRGAPIEVAVVLVAIVVGVASAVLTSCSSALDDALKRGWDRYERGQYRQAIAEFGKVISLNPKSALAYGGRGILYEKLEDHQKAIADLNKAINLAPEYAGAMTPATYVVLVVP